MEEVDQFTKWATNLQSIAQAGLHYGKDGFDRERYEQVRKIAGEMMQAKTGLPKEQIKTLFLGDEGYQTPKIETRAAIFKDDKILLVRERMAQEWSLPGGWNDYDQTTAQNCVKEAREESGRIVKPVKLIAVQDRNHHNKPILVTHVTKVFYLCKEISGEFVPNDETDACDYFALDNLPKLSLDRNTKEQIEMCFKATKDPNWETVFE
ncbi:NUDIX hydrolase [Lactobacillus amylovorus]|uniref:NUDIX hydrolase N-terminal domain-containing protein n=1 Tax=Lactobacillus amylovorus TaxID=1604 RepID=UPI001F243C37|nr:NUDIX hydrolase [Lactobacillus amylovorus]MDB6221944.1 NUDIX hydrolase [Lactobacillus amylovorus]MDB6239529.1 NUDIX hydrolase [Lactobacillus amylovorus]UIK34278.1 NUDIX hydrolase [Lactobacillus amylovorus]UNL45804.1 NUDIX hydrolase [Lactobacillus amylovorus]